MKKIISAVLVIVSIFTLVSCSKYQPQKSTKEELETVLTLSANGINYEVPYEVYRAFFLNRRSEIDGGDLSVWTGEKKEEYISKIDAIIIPEIAEIYAVFQLCYESGIDIYSNIVEESIEDYITVSVEGGVLDGMNISGYDGDYQAYLAGLKTLNMNDSVQRLLFRYAVCSELLDLYYKDKSGEGNIPKYTRDDVRNYYFSEDTVRLIYHFFDRSTPIWEEINTDEKITKMREGMISRTEDETAVATYIISETAGTEDIRDGWVISKNSLDGIYYSELINEAFSLGMHDVSQPIILNSGTVDGVYLLYKAEKSSDHFEKCYSKIESSFVSETVGKRLSEIKTALVLSATKAQALTERDYSTITMG